MNIVRWINRSKIILVVLFAVGCAIAWGYQLMYVKPAKQCEAANRWWYGPERACGVPVEISTITGRPKAAAAPTAQKAAPSAPKAP